MSILGGSKLGIPKALIHGHSQALPWPLENMCTSAGPCLQGSHEESPLGLTLRPSEASFRSGQMFGGDKGTTYSFNNTY